jgi:hypothetical protein
LTLQDYSGSHRIFAGDSLISLQKLQADSENFVDVGGEVFGEVFLAHLVFAGILGGDAR